MELNRNEMKKIMGGLTDPGTGTECRTTCKSGRDAVVSDCTGMCIAMPDQYAKCVTPYSVAECTNN